MKLIREMSLVKDRVKALLVTYPHLRDSDNKLIATIWRSELFHKGVRAKGITAEDFLFIYSEGKISNAETIRRVRQKLQEENPDLRGTVNEARKEQAEDVRKNI